MISILFIFLQLSFSAIALDSTPKDTARFNVDQEQGKSVQPTGGEMPVESIYLCDPAEEAQMPETFY